MVIRQLLLALEMPMGHPLVSQSLLPKPVTFKYNFVENTLEIMLTHKSRLQKKRKKKEKKLNMTISKQSITLKIVKEFYVFKC